jgi:hypothetical protein
MICSVCLWVALLLFFELKDEKTQSNYLGVWLGFVGPCDSDGARCDGN